MDAWLRDHLNRDTTERVVQLCKRCQETTGKLPRTVELPGERFSAWVLTYGPLMRVYCMWMARQPTFEEEAETPDGGDLIPTCTMRVRRILGPRNTVAVVDPRRDEP